MAVIKWHNNCYLSFELLSQEIYLFLSALSLGIQKNIAFLTGRCFLHEEVNSIQENQGLPIWAVPSVSFSPLPLLFLAFCREKYFQ